MPPPPGLKIDVGCVAAELAKQPDVTTGGTVHLGEIIVNASGLVSQSGELLKFSPEDISVTDAGFLGRGSSGSVRKVKRTGTDSYMALKEIKITSQSHLQEIRRELETLHVLPGEGSAARCPHLVDFYGAFSHEGCVYIAMECMDGSLADLNQVPAEILVTMTHDVLIGLDYLHSDRRLMHRDLKPSNLLFKVEEGIVKISDFGVSSTLDQHHRSTETFVGTVTYMSPERLLGEFYSFAGDIWSLGIAVAELALGTHPYAAMTSRSDSTEAKFWTLVQHLNRSEKPPIELPEALDPLLADFITQCLRKDPNTRPTARDLLQHPWITTQSPVATDKRNHEGVRAWLRAKLQKTEDAAAAPQKPAIDLDSALKRLVDIKKK